VFGVGSASQAHPTDARPLTAVFVVTPETVLCCPRQQRHYRRVDRPL